MVQKLQLTKKAVLPRVIRTPVKTFRILCAAYCPPAARILCFALTLCILNTSMAGAIETTKASGLFLEERKGHTSSLSNNSPLSRKSMQESAPLRSPLSSSCLKLLSLNASPKHKNDTGRRLGSRTSSGNAAVPVALGLFFGARLALGPKKITPSSKRFQIGPELRGTSHSGHSYALAVAAYRKCEKEGFLNAPK